MTEKNLLLLIAYIRPLIWPIWPILYWQISLFTGSQCFCCGKTFYEIRRNWSIMKQWVFNIMSVCLSVCVCLFLTYSSGKQTPSNLRRTVLSFMACLPACLDLPYFHTLSHKPHDFLEKLYWTKKFRFPQQLLSEIFLILRKIQRDIIINIPVFPFKLPEFLVRF